MSTVYFDALLVGARCGVLHFKIGHLELLKTGAAHIKLDTSYNLKGLLVVPADSNTCEFTPYEDQSLSRFPELDDAADFVCVDNELVNYCGWKSYLQPHGFLWPIGQVPTLLRGEQ